MKGGVDRHGLPLHFVTKRHVVNQMFPTAKNGLLLIRLHF